MAIGVPAVLRSGPHGGYVALLGGHGPGRDQLGGLNALVRGQGHGDRGRAGGQGERQGQRRGPGPPLGRRLVSASTRAQASVSARASSRAAGRCRAGPPPGWPGPGSGPRPPSPTSPRRPLVRPQLHRQPDLVGHRAAAAGWPRPRARPAPRRPAWFCRRCASSWASSARRSSAGSSRNIPRRPRWRRGAGRAG